MFIKLAEKVDLEAILELQYLAYQSEAKLLNNYSIPPLKQTLEEVEQEYYDGIILKAVNEDDIIIGSVRSHIVESTVFIGKLMVHPTYQGKGIGSKLLIEIEKNSPKKRYELFTSDKSLKNLKLYERMGYQKFKEIEIMSNLKLMYLEKNTFFS